jgi:hypothetical protein
MCKIQLSIVQFTDLENDVTRHGMAWCGKCRIQEEEEEDEEKKKKTLFASKLY